MPGKEDEGGEIMRWLGLNLSKDLFLNIMEQYHPDDNIGKLPRSVKGLSEAESPARASVTKPADEPAPSTSARHSEINRLVTSQEVSSVRVAAKVLGSGDSLIHRDMKALVSDYRCSLFDGCHLVRRQAEQSVGNIRIPRPWRPTNGPFSRGGIIVDEKW